MSKVISLVKKYPFPFIILLIQVCLLAYFNLFQHQNYLGFDASVYYLQVIESWKQKSLILDHWIGQTTLGLDSQIPLATLIYGLTDNVFLSMGISNIIITIFFVLVLCFFIRSMKVNGFTAILFFALLFTPFISKVEVSNNLDYFFMMFFGSGAYLLRSALCFLIYYVYYKFYISQYSKFEVAAAAICLALAFVSAVSSGFFVLMFGVAPLFLHYFVCLIQDGAWNREKKNSLLFLLILLIVSVFGKAATEHFLGFEIRDSIASWVSLGQFWKNLSSIFAGFLGFVGALPLDEGVNILSVCGIGFCFGILIAVALLTGTALSIRSLLRGKKDATTSIQFILTCVLLGHLIIFALCYTTYGSPIFELRYLIISFIILSLLFTQWVDRFFEANQSKTIKFLFVFCIWSCVIGANIYSYYYVYQCRSDYATAVQIVEQVHEYESPVVYVPGSDLVVLARNLRVIDPTRVYKASYDMGNLVNAYHWGDYTYYDDAGDYSGPTVMLCTDEFYNALPNYLMAQYNLQMHLNSTNIGLYTSTENPIDMQSGIVDEINKDYFYSQGISTYATGYFDEKGNFVTDGTGGCATWGPYTATPVGTYEFTLHYEVKECSSEVAGQFDVAVDAAPIAVVDLQTGENTATLEVTFDETSAGGLLEYRSYVNDGAVIALKSVEIKKIS